MQDLLFLKYSLLLDLLENGRSLKDTEKNGNMIRRKWKRKVMTVREEEYNFPKSLRDLGDQISGKFKWLEALLITYPVYQEKTSYKNLALVMLEAKQLSFTRIHSVYPKQGAASPGNFPSNTSLAAREQLKRRSAWKE